MSRQTRSRSASWTKVQLGRDQHMRRRLQKRHWLRLHAAGRKVIGLTAVDRNQTDYRLPRPISASDLAVLLSEIAGDLPAASASASQPAQPLTEAIVARPQPVVHSTSDDAAEAPVTLATPEPPAPQPAPQPEPVVVLTPDRPLSSWLDANGLQRRVRLQRDAGPVVLLDPRSKVWHGPVTLKPLLGYFEGTLLIEDFETPDAAAWDAEAAKLGAAQPLSRLQWLGGLLGGHGSLLPGNDPDGKYRLIKWPQTEREYPKHFRIATAMMKGPATVTEVADASGVSKEEVADFINANLATGYAEFVPPAAPEPDTPAQKQAGGLFGRMRGR